MERPTLRQLEILTEVARAGTFRGAARHLGLSQVAVSDHIKQLENRLGCALFVRNAGGKPTLSPSGRIVLEHGRNVLFACDALIAAARGAEGEEVAPVEIPATLAYEADLPENDTEPNEGQTVVAAEPEPEIDLTALSPQPSLIPALPSLSGDRPIRETRPAPAKEERPTPDPERETPELDPEIPAGPDVGTEEPEPEFSRIFRPLLPSIEEKTGAAEPEPAPTAAPLNVPEPPSAPEAIPDSEKPITVASHPAILSRFQDRLAAAQEAFPDRPIAVDFARFTPNNVRAALGSGRVDIALFYSLGEVPGLPSDYLWSERWSLFARHDHPLAQLEAVRFKDCEDMLVILFDSANPIRPLSEACLAQAGLWPTPTVLETDDFAAIAAELDYGEAIFPAFGVTAQQFAARPGLKRLALVEQLPGIEIRRAISGLSHDDPTISALAGLLG